MDTEKIKESVKILKQNKVDFEFRMTVVPGLFEKDDFIKIGEWLKGSKRFCLQQFRNNVCLDKEFEKVDIRIGTIERVEDIKDSNKLVRLIVEFGDHKRNILAGIKQERTDTSEIEGKQALFVVNLEPRKMMGELSEGMLFDIGYADGITPVLAVPEKTVPNGSRAG